MKTTHEIVDNDFDLQKVADLNANDTIELCELVSSKMGIKLTIEQGGELFDAMETYRQDKYDAEIDDLLHESNHH